MKRLITACALVIACAFTSPVVMAAPGDNLASRYPNSGKVLDVIDTDLYTYVQVSSKGQEIWLAASKTKVEKGNTLYFGSGAVMSNFHSKSLNRTFPTITFVDKVEAAK